MFDRILRAIRLDKSLYREVADNESLTTEAVLIVVVVAIIGSIGTALASNNFIGSYLLTVANQLLIGWLLWAVVTYLVGNMFGGRSSVPEMARTLAYASAPRLLGVLGFIPCLGWIFVFAGWVLSLVAAVIGIRESMEFDTTKALITAVIGFGIYLIVSIIIGVVFGATASLFAQ
jgi:hypothetical protein